VEEAAAAGGLPVHWQVALALVLRGLQWVHLCAPVSFICTSTAKAWRVVEQTERRDQQPEAVKKFNATSPAAFGDVNFGEGGDHVEFAQSTHTATRTRTRPPRPCPLYHHEYASETCSW
jgi:hypothetical protein